MRIKIKMILNERVEKMMAMEMMMMMRDGILDPKLDVLSPWLLDLFGTKLDLSSNNFAQKREGEIFVAC